MTLTFACGHVGAMNARDSGATVPVCPACGDRRVRHVSDVRPPTFRGVASGPSARTEALGAVPLMLAPSGSLRMKEHS